MTNDEKLKESAKAVEIALTTAQAEMPLTMMTSPLKSLAYDALSLVANVRASLEEGEPGTRDTLPWRQMMGMDDAIERLNGAGYWVFPRIEDGFLRIRLRHPMGFDETMPLAEMIDYAEEHGKPSPAPSEGVEEPDWDLRPDSVKVKEWYENLLESWAEARRLLGLPKDADDQTILETLNEAAVAREFCVIPKTAMHGDKPLELCAMGERVQEDWFLRYPDGSFEPTLSLPSLHYTSGAVRAGARFYRPVPPPPEPPAPTVEQRERAIHEAFRDAQEELCGSAFDALKAAVTTQVGKIVAASTQENPHV